MTWFAQLGAHTAYVDGVLGPLILTGIGLGMVIAPSINAGTFGVEPRDAGVASATVTVGQQLGASIGISLLNTIFASAVTSYLAAHAASASAARRWPGWRWRTATTPRSGGSPASSRAARSSAASCSAAGRCTARTTRCRSQRRKPSPGPSSP